MNEDLLLLIGDKIKTKRTQKNITLEQLAQKAGVSKGLISQIENNRTVPSLPVCSISSIPWKRTCAPFSRTCRTASATAMSSSSAKGKKNISKGAGKGFVYKRILTRSIASQATDVVLLELKKKADRHQMIRTDAFECKYVLKGRVEYQIEKEISCWKRAIRCSSMAGRRTGLRISVTAMR